MQEVCVKNDTSSHTLQGYFTSALCVPISHSARSLLNPLCCSFKIAQSDDASPVDRFVNLLFNNLNWTVTEFLVALKEIETAAKNRAGADLRDLQRKCNITFELATFLFKCVFLVELRIECCLQDARGLDLLCPGSD